MKFDSKEDKKLSSYTGWTWQHWIELAEKMIFALQPFLTPGKGGLNLPNPVRWMDAFLPNPGKMKTFYWMEGYSRSRLLIVAWMLGTGKTELIVNGQKINLLDQFIEGLLNASDPKHPEWIGDRYGNNQWIAETSTVAFALYFLRELVWTRLNENEKNKIAVWLSNATGQVIPHNNWYLFIANTNLVLKALNREYNKDELDHCINMVRTFDLENGWFTDGDEKRGFSIEQYNAWGFHYFLPAFVLMGGLSTETNDWIINRLQKFIKSFYNFFAGNGAIPMWGRSWAYRPALTTPFLLAEMLGVSPLESGETRRLVSGQMKYYVENNYLDHNLLPTMGYVGENLDLIDPYSQYGSPYWSVSAFMCLLLSESQKYWTDTEKPFRVERESYCVTEKEIGLLVQGNNQTGEVQVINHRVWHQKEGPGTKYAKKYTNFAYSSHFGIDLRRDENGYNCDNMFAVSPDGKKYSQRIIPYFLKADKDYGVSSYYPLSGFPFVSEKDIRNFSADTALKTEEDKSVQITTHIYLKKFSQIRVYILESKHFLAGIKEGGFALNFSKNIPNYEYDADKMYFYNGNRGVFIRQLSGNYRTGELEKLLDNTYNCNTLGGRSVTPILTDNEIQPGKHIFVSHTGTWIGNEGEVAKYFDLVKEVHISVDEVIVKFSDDSEFKFLI